MKVRDEIREKFKDVREVIKREGYNPLKHDKVIISYAKRYGIRSRKVLARVCGIGLSVLSEYIRECLLSDTFSEEFVGVSKKIIHEIGRPVRKGECAASWDTLVNSGYLPKDKYVAFLLGSRSRTLRILYAELLKDTFSMDISIQRISFFGVVKEKGADPSIALRTHNGSVFVMDDGSVFYANSRLGKYVHEGQNIEAVCTLVTYPDGTSRAVATGIVPIASQSFSPVYA